MTNHSSFNTVGDVRHEVDEIINQQDLHTTGGMYNPYNKSVIFEVANCHGERIGDAYCALPKDGWVAETYMPNTNNPADGLHFRIIEGAGKLVLPLEATLELNEQNQETTARLTCIGDRPFQIVNTSENLLVVLASSTLDHTYHTNIHEHGNRQLNDSWGL